MLRWSQEFNGVAKDPLVPKNQMGITTCSRCDAAHRIANRLRTAFDPSEFDAVELD
jgi:hypothetical protein